MRIICRKTNVEFVASGFNSMKVYGEHPIFHADYSTLLRIAESYRKHELDERERRLLFVALLDSTRLIEFRVPAIPSDPLILRYMEYLLRTVTWQQETRERIPLNKICIDRGTRELDNIGVWLDNWNNSRREFITSGNSLMLREAISRAEDRLRRMMSRKDETEDYAKQLANWFMTAGQVPEGLKEYWTSLFMLRSFAVYSASAKDLEELRQHIIDHVPMNSTYAMACYRHIDGLRVAAEKGILGALTGNSNYSIVDGDDIEQHNLGVIISTAAAEEPQRRDFTSQVSYLIARAKWRLRMSEEQRATQEPEKLVLPYNVVPPSTDSSNSSNSSNSEQEI